MENTIQGEKEEYLEGYLERYLEGEIFGEIFGGRDTKNILFLEGHVAAAILSVFIVNIVEFTIITKYLFLQYFPLEFPRNMF